MRFKLEFDMDNAAFDDDPCRAAASILFDVSRQLTTLRRERNMIFDDNGNKIGQWSVER